MRWLFLILFLLGAAAGIGTPFFAERLAGAPVGTFSVYRPAAGFQSVQVALGPSDAPLRMLLDLEAPGPFVPDASLSSATLTVAGNGRTVFAKPVPFGNAVLSDDNPQTPQREFRVEAGVLPTLEQGSYTFTVSRGEAEIPQVTGFGLTLQRGTPAFVRFVQPAGFALLAVGFIGFMLTAFRRTQTVATQPRWGRDAAGG